MSDVAKARQMLREIQRLADCPKVFSVSDLRGICDKATTALRALGERGEPEPEVWVVGRDGNDGPDCWYVAIRSSRIIASQMNEPTARRIASDHNRLPALERAARRVNDALANTPLSASGMSHDSPQRQKVVDAHHALRDALEQEPGQ